MADFLCSDRRPSEANSWLSGVQIWLEKRITNLNKKPGPSGKEKTNYATLVLQEVNQGGPQGTRYPG